MKNIDPYSTCQIGQTHPYPFKQARYDTFFSESHHSFQLSILQEYTEYSTLHQISVHYYTVQYITELFCSLYSIVYYSTIHNCHVIFITVPQCSCVKCIMKCRLNLSSVLAVSPANQKWG